MKFLKLQKIKSAIKKPSIGQKIGGSKIKKPRFCFFVFLYQLFFSPLPSPFPFFGEWIIRGFGFAAFSNLSLGVLDWKKPENENNWLQKARTALFGKAENEPSG